MANPPLFPILQKAAATVVDPVCHMNVDPQRAAGSSTLRIAALEGGDVAKYGLLCRAVGLRHCDGR